jgi:hypothetical protein
VDNSRDLQGAPSFPRSVREDGDFDFRAQEQSKPNSPPVLPTKRRGEVAEAAFLHKAASLGFSISKPWGESDRYDFILDSGDHCWRVQVKSAHTSAINGYSFHACGNVQSRRYTPRDIDFLVGYVVPDNVWYVLPIELFSTITGVKVFPSSKRRMSRYELYREAWHYFGEPRTSGPSTENK